MNNYFAENIKFLRQQYNMSQSEFGKIVGKTYSAISFWERGLREPSNEDIERICQHFNIEPTVLCYMSMENDIDNRIEKKMLLNFFKAVGDIGEQQLAYIMMIISYIAEGKIVLSDNAVDLLKATYDLSNENLLTLINVASAMKG